MLEHIYKTQVRPILQSTGGLTKEKIENFFENGFNRTCTNSDFETVILSVDQLEQIKKRAIKDFVFEVEHLYIRGEGLNNDESEHNELDKAEWTYYWKHRNYLIDNVYPTNPNIVESIDYETDQIIKKLPDPTEQETFLEKGLVLGYVQSGKTANFTHLISKASSIGYKFVIVLGGMTNALRNQTQYRLDKELSGNSWGDKTANFVNWHRSEPKYRMLTGQPNYDFGQNYDGDFRIPQSGFSETFAHSNDVHICVIKKLARDNGNSFGSTIGRLLRWIEITNDTGTFPPTLIIDDEADQASVDGTDVDDGDTDPTVINRAVRTLISKFPQVAYVGYTATPFANIFIDMDQEHNGLPDLYPDDFIWSLPEPEQYFGTKVFFKNNSEYYREIENEDEKELVNQGDLTEALSKAILDFSFATMVRRARGDDKHCAMLVHTDHRNLYHGTVADTIQRYLDSILALTDLTDIRAKWIQYISESEKIVNQNGYTKEKYSFESANFLGDKWDETFVSVVNEAKVKVVNAKNEALDYSDPTSKTMICVGGNILSRGLTIEGLTISYYLRNPGNLDTLLQMARWYGYRIGYEDLVRVYTTKSLFENFSEAMLIEDDLREELRRYVEEKGTPRDFAPRVRAHSRMMPTAKMGRAHRSQSYNNRMVQTFQMSRHVPSLESNNTLIENLINKLGVQISDQVGVANKVTSAEIIEFLKSYTKFNKDYESIDFEDLISFVESRNKLGELLEWDVGCRGRRVKYPNSNIDSLGLNPVKRSARGGTGWNEVGNNYVNIGVISDSNDFGHEALQFPKLMFYPICRVESNSFQVCDVKKKKPILPETVIPDLNFNPIGFAIGFPRSKSPAAGIEYWQQ